MRRFGPLVLIRIWLAEAVRASITAGGGPNMTLSLGIASASLARIEGFTRVGIGPRAGSGLAGAVLLSLVSLSLVACSRPEIIFTCEDEPGIHAICGSV